MYEYIINKCTSLQRYSFCFSAEGSTEAPTEGSAEASLEGSVEDLCKDLLWNIANEEYKDIFSIAHYR